MADSVENGTNHLSNSPVRDCNSPPKPELTQPKKTVVADDFWKENDPFTTTWEDWTVVMKGLVKQPNKFSMDQLVNQFPKNEFSVTLVCSANHRKEQNMVCFESAEDLHGGKGYGTSLRKKVAMVPLHGIILALMQNGKLLSPDHGFPVKIIMPRFIGGRMVKSLKRIIVTPTESDNYYHFRDNIGVLPSHADAELAYPEAWWYNSEYIINELNINSVITKPYHKYTLPIKSTTTPYKLEGYAYSGGGKKVTRIELTMDGGDTWRECTVDHPEKPNQHRKYWCWCFWSVGVQAVDLIDAKEIAIRAWDDTLNTQPGSFRVKINVQKLDTGEIIAIVFEHSIQPKKISCKLISKTKLSHDVRLFKFKFDHQHLRLPVGKYIFLGTTIKDKRCTRPYTPINTIDNVGYFDLVVRIYFPKVEFSNGGVMSQHLESLPLESRLDLEGPCGQIEYTGRGNFTVNGEHKRAIKLAMVARRTGITPIYQVIEAILKDPEDKTMMYLVYANQNEDDILLRDKLDGWAEKYSDKLKVWYVVEETKREGWEYSVGFVTESILREHLPGASHDTLALACGRSTMIESDVKPNLEKIGYDIKNSLLLWE